MTKFSVGIVLFFAVLFSLPVAQGEIVIDFSDDAAADDFFGMSTTESMQARAAVIKAAADISAVLNATLDPISTYQAQGTATSGQVSTTATFNGVIGYTNPSDGGNFEIFSPATLMQDEIRVFVGARILSDTMDPDASINNVLGQGGPGGSGGSAGANNTNSTLPDAVAEMEVNANALFGRGGDGPIIGTTSGSLGGNAYSVGFTSTLGNLWFDSDTDNDGDFDTPSELSDFWHFDANSSVPNNRIDFYSVALHEMLHAIGIGTADSWDDLVSDFIDADTSRDWLGPNAIALAGSGSGLIEPDAAHIEIGTTSLRLSDGESQEVVMDPNISFGQRKELTQLDVAFLQDIGWANANSDLQTNAIPEPATASLLGLTMLVFATRRRRV